MTNILYRGTTTPTVPTSSTSKGTPLTNLEMDANLKSISDDIGTKAATSTLNAGIQTASDNAVAMAIALG